MIDEVLFLGDDAILLASGKQDLGKDRGENQCRYHLRKKVVGHLGHVCCLKMKAINQGKYTLESRCHRCFIEIYLIETEAE